MYGRCIRRGAGTSSLLETASASNTRTSWARGTVTALYPHANEITPTRTRNSN